MTRADLRLARVLACASVLPLAGPLACTKEEPPILPATLPTADEEPASTIDGGSDAAPIGRGDTGDPCTGDGDCRGTSPSCSLEKDGVVFPGGQCTSTCDVGDNDPKTGRNPSCPGSRGICIEGGKCARACTARTKANPCRDGYSCFVAGAHDACSPTGISQCDPTKAGGCPPADGGARTCVRVGVDPVGKCTEGCNVFTQGCSQPGFACFPNAFGEGTCLRVTADGTDGTPCVYKNDCSEGFGCAQSGLCRPYCGGPDDVACSNGKICVDFEPAVPVSITGVCDG